MITHELENAVRAMGECQAHRTGFLTASSRHICRALDPCFFFFFFFFFCVKSEHTGLIRWSSGTAIRGVANELNVLEQGLG
jgi:hypothetical protein